jgi:hypothetical protein
MFNICEQRNQVIGLVPWLKKLQARRRLKRIVSVKRIWSDLHLRNGDLEVLDDNMK